MVGPAAAQTALAVCCREGQLGVLVELLALTGNRAVGVHAKEAAAFRGACVAGHTVVVRELLALEGTGACTTSPGAAT